VIPSVYAQQSEDDLNLLYSKALEAIEQQMYEQAIGYHEAVLEIEPDNGAALNKTGYSLSSFERYKEAIQYYDKALAIDPNDTCIIFSNETSTLALLKAWRPLGHFDIGSLRSIIPRCYMGS
jgi:tetratricopeptide (TPR) repeat protein